jgi:hypothetical protein
LFFEFPRGAFHRARSILPVDAPASISGHAVDVSEKWKTHFRSRRIAFASARKIVSAKEKRRTTLKI